MSSLLSYMVAVLECASQVDYSEFLTGISSFRHTGDKALRCEMLCLLVSMSRT